MLTIFITTFGRYQYLHTPYGISSILEHHNCHMSKSFKGLSWFVCVVDDFVMYNITDCISLVIQLLQHSKVDNIVLNVANSSNLKLHLEASISQ